MLLICVLCISFCGLACVYGLPRALGGCKEVGKRQEEKRGQILCRGAWDGFLRQNQGKTWSNKQTRSDKSHSNRLLAKVIWEQFWFYTSIGFWEPFEKTHTKWNKTKVWNNASLIISEFAHLSILRGSKWHLPNFNLIPPTALQIQCLCCCIRWIVHCLIIQRNLPLQIAEYIFFAEYFFREICLCEYFFLRKICFCWILFSSEKSAIAKYFFFREICLCRILFFLQKNRPLLNTFS